MFQFLFYKNLKSSFTTWLGFFYIFGFSGPWCATAAARLPNNIHLFSTFSLKLWRKLCCFYNSGNTVLYVLHWPYLNDKIWKKLSTHVYVFLRTERRNKYCKFEYFKIIQCKVLDHTLKQILYYCYTANCANEKN